LADAVEVQCPRPGQARCNEAARSKTGRQR
jgi:hypothetical protein